MSDWLSMEQRVEQTKAEAKALTDHYMEWQPPRRGSGLLARLMRLMKPRPAKPEQEPQPVRPAFR